MSLRFVMQVRTQLDRIVALFSPDWRWTAILAASAALYATQRILLPNKGQINTFASLSGVAVGLLSFALMYVATRPQMPVVMRVLVSRFPRWSFHPIWRILLTAYVLFMFAQIAGQRFATMSIRGQYTVDALAYAHMDTDLFLQGLNPYTSNFAYWDAALRWPEALTTPLMGGVFGNNPLHYPGDKRIARNLQYQAIYPPVRSGQDFDTATIHNYPAGIIWLMAPFVRLGLPSVVWLNIIAWLVAIGIIISRAPPEVRAPIAFTLLISPLYLNTVLTNFDINCIVFVLVAWNWFDRKQASPLAMGFACAVKQIAWFFLPFYLLEVVKREGIRSAVQRLGWVAIAFIVPNLPFIVMSPTDWVKSIFVPLTDPMFPMGVGAISLMFGGVVPVLPAKVWTLLELSVMGALLVYQWYRQSRNDDAILFALIPLWFSWRSLLNYFSWLPLLATWLAATQVSLAAHFVPEEAPAPQSVTGSLIDRELVKSPS